MSHYSHYIHVFTPALNLFFKTEALRRVCVGGEKQFTVSMVNVSDLPDDDKQIFTLDSQSAERQILIL